MPSEQSKLSADPAGLPSLVVETCGSPCAAGHSAAGPQLVKCVKLYKYGAPYFSYNLLTGYSPDRPMIRSQTGMELFLQKHAACHLLSQLCSLAPEDPGSLVALVVCMRNCQLLVPPDAENFAGCIWQLLLPLLRLDLLSSFLQRKRNC